MFFLLFLCLLCMFLCLLHLSSFHAHCGVHLFCQRMTRIVLYSILCIVFCFFYRSWPIFFSRLQ
ncbi:hypothetical protein J3E72DRAFT_293735 [Bipolaris maydis]|nr:hypothetical protein J3E73DRAFT_272103 [Bipolaris maydis]KAJ5064865.1 hypothetical protein J3E74DRAFT_297386 [Bipolaris maydis]KAJ6200078.1 hypothetical protein J3E72DRAFT_293735 [Bipolaris maydis]KAJ6285412.1 hypothetical protein J3E71DRAFT_254795 [Bipolaris maydis]